MRRSVRIVIFSLAIVISFWSCSKDLKEEYIPESVGLKIDTVTFNHSMKGWELYSWTENSAWTYSLLIGTNAIKTLAQVKNNPIRIVGEDSLKLLLAKLPKGEEIYWIGKQWLINTWNSDFDNIELPPRNIQLNIKEFCDSKDLKLQIEE